MVEKKKRKEKIREWEMGGGEIKVQYDAGSAASAWTK